MTLTQVPGPGAQLHTAKPVIGLAVGRGTGPEVADVFEQVLGALTARHPHGVAIERSPRLYHSYVSLRAERDVARIRALTAEDADHYERFCRTRAGQGTEAIFRVYQNAGIVLRLTYHNVSATPHRQFLNANTGAVIRF